MSSEYLGEPCRNFCIMDACIVKWRDGRQKAALGSWVGGGGGVMIFVDLETFETITIPLPDDEGGESFVNLNDEKLIIGTSLQRGCVLSLDLKTLEWAEPRRIDGEVFIQEMVLAEDGYIYCTTSYGCLLLKYDPVLNTLESLGRVSQNPENINAMGIYSGIPGKIFINCGLAEREVVVWDMTTKTFANVFEPGTYVTHIGPDYIRTVNNEKIRYHDRETLAVIEHEEIVVPDLRLDDTFNVMATGPDGTKIGMRGQMCFKIAKHDQKPVIHTIDADPPATDILTLAAAENGLIWGSTTLGQTIFSYDPATGEYCNTPNVTDSNGEVYGMQVIDGKIFMAAYCHSEHIIYDPSQPWDQLNNINPKTFFMAYPKLIRPNAKSTIGPDGAFWTAWMQSYGTYGCGITRADPHTLKTDIWTDLVPNQGSRSITGGEKYIYFSTYGAGNGLVSRPDNYCVIVYDTDCREITRKIYPRNIVPNNLRWLADRLLVCIRDTIEILDGETLEPVYMIPIDGYLSGVTKFDETHVCGFINETFVLVDLVKGVIDHSEPAEARASTSVRGVDGCVYYASGKKLFRIRISPQEAI